MPQGELKECTLEIRGIRSSAESPKKSKRVYQLMLLKALWSRLTHWRLDISQSSSRYYLSYIHKLLKSLIIVAVIGPIIIHVILVYYGFYPFLIIKIPFYRFFYSLFKWYPRFPSKFIFYLCWVDGISSIMPFSILYKLNEFVNLIFFG